MKRRGRPPYPDLLTPREQEVLALLRKGLSNEQIAQRLGISLAGAKYHVSEILSKLGVSSRDEAARWSDEGPRPWWLAAFAPFVSLRHRFGWLPQVALGATAVALIAAATLLIWGLLRTDGDGEALSGTFPLPFCEVDLPDSWQAAIDDATIPVPQSVSFQAATVAPDATQVFGAYHSDAWSGVAALDREGTLTQIKSFDAPDNDSIWSAAFDGRWLAWTERHSFGSLGGADLYVWDGVTREIMKLSETGVVGPVISQGRLVWSEPIGDPLGQYGIHFYSLVDQQDHVVTSERPRAPILFAGDSVLFRESIAGGGSQFRMLDFSTGELAPISEPFASIASSSVVQSANLTAWVSGSSVYVLPSRDGHKMRVSGPAGNDQPNGPFGIAGDIVSWQVQTDGNYTSRAADLTSGSIASFPEGSSLWYADERALVVVTSEEQATKSLRAHLNTALVNVDDLPPLPRCAS